jgi:tetratricopeptide (TPR) repeat protein
MFDAPSNNRLRLELAVGVITLAVLASVAYSSGGTSEVRQSAPPSAPVRAEASTNSAGRGDRIRPPDKGKAGAGKLESKPEMKPKQFVLAQAAPSTNSNDIGYKIFPAPIGKELPTPINIPHYPGAGGGGAAQIKPAEAAPMELTLPAAPDVSATPRRPEVDEPGANDGDGWYKLALAMIAVDLRDKAKSSLQRAVDAAERSENWAVMASASFKLGAMYNDDGDAVRAETMFKRGLKPTERQGDQAHLSEIYAVLGDLYHTRGDQEQTQGMYQRQLELAERRGEKQQQSLVLGKLASIRNESGDTAGAETLAEKGLEIAANQSDRPGMVRSLITLASVYQKKGDAAKSCTFAHKACDLYAQADQPADAEECRVAAERDLKCSAAPPEQAAAPQKPVREAKITEARSAEPQSAEIKPVEALPVGGKTNGAEAKANGESAPQPQAGDARIAKDAEQDAPPTQDVARLLKEGKQLAAAGNLVKAQASFKKALALAVAAKDKKTSAIVMAELGHVFQASDDLDGAESAFEQSLAVREQLGQSEGVARMSEALGVIYRTRANFPKSEDMFKKALGLDETASRTADLARDYYQLGLLHLLEDKLDVAEKNMNKSIEIHRTLHAEKGVADGNSGLGQIYFKRGDLDRAIEMFKKAVAIQSAMGIKSAQALSYSNLGAVYLKKKEKNTACGYWRKAQDLFRKANMKPQLERVEEMLSGDDCDQQGQGKPTADASQ